MEIIAQKNEFYLNDKFFNEIIKKESVDGVALNIVYNRENEILVYNCSTSRPYSVWIT